MDPSERTMRDADAAGPLLEVRNLETSFFVKEGVIPAVDDVSFQVERGRVLGVVGESGCGKSVTALSIMRLVSFPGRIVGGKALYDGRDLLQLPEWEMRRIRGNKISMIFQEPMTSLNPVFTIGNQIMESVLFHERVSRAEARNRAIDMLRLVGIPAPEKRIQEYPHQLSGGMRQRVMIAIALSCEPGFLIADEPTTALDVTIQAQILDLIGSLRERLGMAILFITHDFGVIAENAHEVMVMYAGKVVETASTSRVLENPLHPYTRGLIGSIPHITPESRGKIPLHAIQGSVPILLELPNGCRFRDRCEEAFGRCAEAVPELVEVEPGHSVRCFKRQEEMEAGSQTGSGDTMGRQV